MMKKKKWVEDFEFIISLLITYSQLFNNYARINLFKRRNPPH